MSRLPYEQTVNNNSEIVDYINFVKNRVPINGNIVRVELKKDLTLNKVYKYMEQVWPNKVEEDLKEYFKKIEKLSIKIDIIMWGFKRIISSKLKK